MSSFIGRVVVYGGKGALGNACITHFKANNFWVGSVDLAPNELADFNVIVPRDGSWYEQECCVLDKFSLALKDDKLDAIICVAGGWTGGNAQGELSKSCDMMWRQSVWSSEISAALAARHLKPDGILTLTGAQAALKGTPSMIGYGMAKAAVMHLAKSLAEKGSGLPENATVATILPVALDTPLNRKCMPKADFSKWTPLSEVADLFVKWVKKEECPKSGAFLQMITQNGITNIIDTN